MLNETVGMATASVPDASLCLDARLGFLLLISATLLCTLALLVAGLVARASRPVVVWSRDPGGGGGRPMRRPPLAAPEAASLALLGLPRG
jgi:hypothetical protein